LIRDFNPAAEKKLSSSPIGAILFDLLLPYFPRDYVNWESNGIVWSPLGDIGMIAGVFTLGRRVLEQHGVVQL
jgi:hypothetical protein